MPRDAPAAGLHLGRGPGLGAAPRVRRHLDLPGPRRGAAPDGDHPALRHVVGDVGGPADPWPATGVRMFANTCRHRGHELLPRGRRATGSRSCAPTTPGPTPDRSVGAAPGFREVDGFDPTARAGRAAGDHVARLGVRPRPAPAGRPDSCRSRSTSATSTPSSRRTTRSAAPGRPAHLRGRGQLEGRRRELPRVLPLPADPPELCQVSPPTSGDNYDLPGAWVGGRMDLRDGMATMSLTGESGGTDPGCPTDAGRVPPPAAQPAGLGAPRLRDDPPAACRSRPAGPGSSAPGTSCPTRRRVPDPAYAVEFWDLTNRQDWAACESVQRGLESPHFRPGPFAPNEDAVARLVGLVSRAYA